MMDMNLLKGLTTTVYIKGQNLGYAGSNLWVQKAKAEIQSSDVILVTKPKLH